jgi:hypothetical protein
MHSISVHVSHTRPSKHWNNINFVSFCKPSTLNIQISCDMTKWIMNYVKQWWLLSFDKLWIKSPDCKMRKSITHKTWQTYKIQSTAPTSGQFTVFSKLKMIRQCDKANHRMNSRLNQSIYSHAWAKSFSIHSKIIKNHLDIDMLLAGNTFLSIVTGNLLPVKWGIKKEKPRWKLNKH